MIISGQHDPHSYSPQFLIDMFEIECHHLIAQIDWEQAELNKVCQSMPVMATDIPEEPKKKKIEPKKKNKRKKKKKTTYTRNFRTLMIEEKIPYTTLEWKVLMLVKQGRAVKLADGRYKFNLDANGNKINWDEIDFLHVKPEPKKKAKTSWQAIPWNKSDKSEYDKRKY